MLPERSLRHFYCRYSTLQLGPILHENGDVGEKGDGSPHSDNLNGGAFSENQSFKQSRSSASAIFAARERVMGKIHKAAKLRVPVLS